MAKTERPVGRRFDSASFQVDIGDNPDLPLDPPPPDPEAGDRLLPETDGPIAIIPIGQFDDDLLKSVANTVAAAFGRAVQLGKALPLPKYAFNPSRAQYHSAAILKRVETIKSSDWEAVVGVCDVDLFVPDVPFIFGEADRSTRAAVISTARLRPDLGGLEARNETTARRLSSEVIHQLGLIRGLAHCPNNRCVMFLSSSVADTDKRGAQFCANCKKRLVNER